MAKARKGVKKTSQSPPSHQGWWGIPVQSATFVWERFRPSAGRELAEDTVRTVVALATGGVEVLRLVGRVGSTGRKVLTSSRPAKSRPSAPAGLCSVELVDLRLQVRRPNFILNVSLRGRSCLHVSGLLPAALLRTVVSAP